MQKTINLLIYCAMTMVLFSCSDDDDKTKPEPKKHEVKFNLSAANISMSNIKSAATVDEFKKYMKCVYYFVCNEKGDYIKSKTFTVDDSFTGVKDNLASGTYEILIISCDKSDLNRDIKMSGNIFNRDINNFSDSADYFYARFSIVVGNDNIAQDLTLKRLVCKLDLKSKSALYPKVKRYEITFYNAPGYSFNFNNTYGSGGYTYNGVLSAEKPKISIVKTYPLLEKKQFSIRFKYFDSNDNLVLDKTIKNVPVENNKCTNVLTDFTVGTVGVTDTGYSLSLSTDWGVSINYNLEDQDKDVFPPTFEKFEYGFSGDDRYFELFAYDVSKIKTFSFKIYDCSDLKSVIFDSTKDKDAEGNMISIEENQTSVKKEINIGKILKKGKHVAIFYLEDQLGNSKKYPMYFYNDK